MDWLSVLSTVGSGGILGGVLSLGKLWGAYKEKKLAFEHEAAMAVVDQDNMKLEIEANKFKAEIELETTELTTDAKALTAAINAEANTKAASPWVQDLKASTRPILTYTLVIMAFITITWNSDSAYADEILFLASTAVTFWFGDRPRKLL